MKNFSTVQNNSGSFLISLNIKIPTKKTIKITTMKKNILLGEVHFSFGKTSLSFNDIAVIESFIPKLKNKKIKLIGYTDNIGPRHMNLKIAKKRANSIRILLGKLGLDKSKIITVARPLGNYKNNNLNNIDRQQNRRVEIFIQTERRISL